MRLIPAARDLEEKKSMSEISTNKVSNHTSKWKKNEKNEFQGEFNKIKPRFFMVK